MLDKLKLGAYLDELHDDPIIASASLLKHGIRHVAIRNVWGGLNVCDSVDSACKQLRDGLQSNDQVPILIASTLGKAPVKMLSKITDAYIDRILHIATYFKAPYIRVGVGTGEISLPEIDAWMDRITRKCLTLNLVPLYEPSDDTALYHPAEIATQLNKFKKWKLLYDPSQLIRRKKMNPYIKYWVLLQKYVAAIDIHDYKIGVGSKPAGFGDSKIVDTLQDAIGNNYQGWAFLEPGLGRRYASAVSKADTFALAVEAIQLIR